MMRAVEVLLLLASSAVRPSIATAVTRRLHVLDWSSGLEGEFGSLEDGDASSGEASGPSSESSESSGESDECDEHENVVQPFVVGVIVGAGIMAAMRPRRPRTANVTCQTEAMPPETVVRYVERPAPAPEIRYVEVVQRLQAPAVLPAVPLVARPLPPVQQAPQMAKPVVHRAMQTLPPPPCYAASSQTHRAAISAAVQADMPMATPATVATAVPPVVRPMAMVTRDVQTATRPNLDIGVQSSVQMHHSDAAQTATIDTQQAAVQTAYVPKVNAGTQTAGELKETEVRRSIMLGAHPRLASSESGASSRRVTPPATAPGTPLALGTAAAGSTPLSPAARPSPARGPDTGVAAGLAPARGAPQLARTPVPRSPRPSAACSANLPTASNSPRNSSSTSRTPPRSPK